MKCRHKNLQEQKLTIAKRVTLVGRISKHFKCGELPVHHASANPQVKTHTSSLDYESWQKPTTTRPESRFHVLRQTWLGKNIFLRERGVVLHFARHTRRNTTKYTQRIMVGRNARNNMFATFLIGNSGEERNRHPGVSSLSWCFCDRHRESEAVSRACNVPIQRAASVHEA